MKRNKISTILIVLGIILLIISSSIVIYNIWEDHKAGLSSKKILNKLNDKIVVPEKPSYLISNEIEMPTITIDGNRYIGVLNIVSLDIELPILSDWSYENMKIAPVRYDGSLYLNNLIIAGHGYVSHFGNIKNLKKGDYVTFTDVEGNVFEFEVIKTEIIDQYDVSGMKSGEWDLTIFTCNYDNTKRITIRLKQINKNY